MIFETNKLWEVNQTKSNTNNIKFFDFMNNAVHFFFYFFTNLCCDGNYVCGDVCQM